MAPLRILLFFEPVIFRNKPALLIAHFMWARTIMRSSDSFALAATAEVCEAWRRDNPGPDAICRCFPIDSFSPLATVGYSRANYAKALYGAGEAPNALTDALREIRSEFAPDIVVMSSQNAFAQHAFFGIPSFFIEQSPLPRLGYPARLSLDPYGHQTASLLGRFATTIKNIELEPAQRRDLICVVDAIKSDLSSRDLKYGSALQALDKIGAQDKVALLVTQPPDWVTYEGAFRPIDPVNLLYAWAQSLPDGWLGVPTYHVGYAPSREMEIALERSCPRLRFLPIEFSQGLTEVLLVRAEGMITISSTSAMTGLLLQRHVVVVGQSPFSSWCIDRPELIAAATPLSQSEVASTLAFLCHRYSHLLGDLDTDPLRLLQIVEQIRASAEPIDWFMDMSDWSIDRVRRSFGFD
jgi:hypothetical protein